MPDLKKPSSRQIVLLIKPASALCNIRCRYCFYCDRPDDLYRDRTERRVMSKEVLREMVRQYLALPVQPAAFCWQGGEPLVAGREFFQQAFEYEAAFGGSGRIVANPVQTNGTLLDEPFARLFAKYKVLIGLSIDGPAEIHDRYRVDAGGNGTHAKAMRAASLLREHSVEFNALAVVTPIGVTRARELYEWYIANDIRFVQFIPNVEHDHATGKITSLSVTAKQYGRFLCELFDLWYTPEGRPPISIRFFENVMEALLGRNPSSCTMAQDCGEYVVVEYNGDIYPCDFLVRSEWRLGNIMETPLPEILSGQRWREFLEIKPRHPRKCRKCPYNFICLGGCPYERLMGGSFDRPPHLCEAYKMFFDHALTRLKKLLCRICPDARERLKSG